MRTIILNKIKFDFFYTGTVHTKIKIVFTYTAKLHIIIIHVFGEYILYILVKESCKNIYTFLLASCIMHHASCIMHHIMHHASCATQTYKHVKNKWSWAVFQNFNSTSERQIMAGKIQTSFINFIQHLCIKKYFLFVLDRPKDKYNWLITNRNIVYLLVFFVCCLRLHACKTK